MGRGGRGHVARHGMRRPPWGVDEMEFRAAGFGLGGSPRSETQRLALGDKTRLDSLGREIEPKPPPQYLGIEKRIQVARERDNTLSRFTRRSLVWYDTELGNVAGDKFHGSSLPSLSARAERAAALSTPPKPFWSDRSGSAAKARQQVGGVDAFDSGSSHEPGATASPRLPGYSGFRPRCDIEHHDPHRYKPPTSLVERAALTSVRRGVYGYRGYIPRDTQAKAVALPIGHEAIETRQQHFMRTTECTTPPPPLAPNVQARDIEKPESLRQRQHVNGKPLDQQPVPPAHARGYAGFVARAAKGHVKHANAGVSQLHSPAYQPPLHFERSMRRPNMVRHGENDHGANRTQLGMSPG